MRKYIVIKKYISESVEPLELNKGQMVKCIEESDPNGSWPNWILCEVDSKRAWVPKQIIERDREIGKIIEDYSSIEFNLEIDEILISEKELNGWIWCYKEKDDVKKSWAPLNYLSSY